MSGMWAGLAVHEMPGYGEKVLKSDFQSPGSHRVTYTSMTHL